MSDTTLPTVSAPRRRLSRRAAWLLVLPLLVPVGLAARSAQDDKPKAAKQEEEHGGDIVFKVESRSMPQSVLFSHEEHLDHGCVCSDCHTDIFKKEFNGNQFKMADINKGKACGVCHTEEPADGAVPAFAPRVKATREQNCAKCHSLRVRDAMKR